MIPSAIVCKVKNAVCIWSSSIPPDICGDSMLDPYMFPILKSHTPGMLTFDSLPEVTIKYTSACMHSYIHAFMTLLFEHMNKILIDCTS